MLFLLLTCLFFFKYKDVFVFYVPHKPAKSATILSSFHLYWVYVSTLLLITYGMPHSITSNFYPLAISNGDRYFYNLTNALSFIISSIIGMKLV